MALNKHFYDLSEATAFSSSNPLSRATRKKNAQVTKFLEKQPVYSRHKEYRKRFPRLITTGEYVFSHCQSDLIDLSSYSKTNGGHHFCLTLIDVYSRYAFAIPIKRKTGEEVARALRETFERLRLYPAFLITDYGKEYRNETVRAYLKSRSINLIHSSSELKSALCERFNKSWEIRLFKYFTHHNTTKWIGVAEKFANAINRSYNRSIKCTPEQVFKGEREPDPSTLRGGEREEKMKKKPKYRVGDRVRLWKPDKTFRRGYEVNWTDEIFLIIKVIESSPPTYRIVDEGGEEIIGRVYEREMVYAA